MTTPPSGHFLITHEHVIKQENNPMFSILNLLPKMPFAMQGQCSC
jgi:hypothetical protein